MDLQEKAKFIEIREVIRKKSPKLAKWIPKPILRYLERTLHQDEINYIMTKYHDRFGLDFVDSLLDELGVVVELEGVENIPLEDSVIFAS
ncbi:MAG TPA: glycerol acyltransferase, partial [Candidatus Sphingobacterium stercorigallinarum]|nr:glycerol acyltransferase [Candidatus Sphingobacterium stercorigallinarum]